jgi:hypothetical protein
MANDFTKQELVDFNNMLDNFEDQLVLSRNVNKYQTDQTDMARANDEIWRLQPYIMDAEDGMDQTGNFDDKTQLSVKSSLNIFKSANFKLDAKEYRDAIQEGRLGKAAAQTLASKVNIAIMNAAANQGSLVVPIATAATGYSDVAECEAVFNEQGVKYFDRYLALSTRDYNGMADNLAARQTLSGKALTAYEKSSIGEVASFDTFKLDYANRLTPAAPGAAVTMSTLDAATNYHVPVATITDVNGVNNVDARYQTITTSTNTGIKAGDCFTVAGIEAVHHITKETTGFLKTFRVVSLPSSTTMVIVPPMTTAQIATPAPSEKQYQNCVNTTQSATAALVWLNTVDARVNPFWVKDALEIIPGRIAVDEKSGLAVMRSTLENGIEVVMSKQTGIDGLKTKIRYDVFFGVNNLCPEMSGIMLFAQT